MRILFLAPQPFFRPRGTCFATERVLDVLGGDGHSIDLLTYPGGADRDLSNVRVLRIPSLPGTKTAPIGPSREKLFLDFVLAGALVERLYLRSYDLIHAVEESAYLAWFLAGRFGIPYLYDMDSLLIDQLRYTGFFRSESLLRWGGRLERKVIRGAAAVTVICDSHERYVRAIAPDQSIHRIEDTPPLVSESAGNSAPSVRRSFGLRDNPLLLYTGNMESYQGIDLMIDAFRIVIGERPDARLVLIGGEPEQIADRVRTLDGGLAEAVFFAGKRNHDAIAAELGDADLLLSPRTLGDNPPLKIYEYLFSGTPIVATRIESHTQVVADKIAFLADAEPDSFARAVLRALADRDEAALRAKRALAYGEANYSPSAFREKVRVLYQAVEEKIRES